MDEENELDSMQGISDEKMTDLFNASIEIENEISRLKNEFISEFQNENIEEINNCWYLRSKE